MKDPRGFYHTSWQNYPKPLKSRFLNVIQGAAKDLIRRTALQYF